MSERAVSEMIERCARALAKFEGTESTYENFGNYRSQMRRFAEAVIREMREPTDEMVSDGIDVLVDYSPKRSSAGATAENVWTAMIDEALK